MTTSVPSGGSSGPSSRPAGGATTPAEPAEKLPQRKPGTFAEAFAGIRFPLDVDPALRPGPRLATDAVYDALASGDPDDDEPPNH